MTETTKATSTEQIPPVPACPLWCELPAGHGWTGRNAQTAGDYDREHRTRGAGVYIASLVEGAAAETDPRIDVEERNELTAAKARELAAELMRLADLAERH